MRLLGFSGTKQEADGVARIVRWLTDNEGLQASDIAILFRGDYQGRFSKPIQEKLEAGAVAVVDFEKAQRLMAEPGTRRMLAVLQLVVNPKDSLAWWSLTHNQDGVGDAALNHFFGLAQERGTTFGEVLTAEAPDFTGLSTLPTARMAKLYGETVATTDALAETVPARSKAWGALVAGLVAEGTLPGCSEELLTAVKAPDEAPDDDGAGITFKEFVSRFGLRLREQVEADQSGVRLMSMAQSKGLTVRACIVVAVENDVVPWPGADVNEGDAVDVRRDDVRQGAPFPDVGRASPGAFGAFRSHQRGEAASVRCPLEGANCVGVGGGVRRRAVVRTLGPRTTSSYSGCRHSGPRQLITSAGRPHTAAAHCQLGGRALNSVR